MMVKLKGPGLASSAAGQLSETLIFSTNKGRAYVKKAAKPKQPRTSAQVTLRLQMDFLSKEWKSLLTADQVTWNDLAAQTSVSPFNAYQSHNLTRARNHQRPTMAFPATETGLDSSLSGVSITPGPRCIHNQLTVNTLQDTWAAYQWVVTGSGVQPTWNQLIDIKNIYALATYKWTVRHLTPGTYWYCWTLATTDGKHTPSGTWRQITVPN